MKSTAPPATGPKMARRSDEPCLDLGRTAMARPESSAPPGMVEVTSAEPRAKPASGLTDSVVRVVSPDDDPDDDLDDDDERGLGSCDLLTGVSEGAGGGPCGAVLPGGGAGTVTLATGEYPESTSFLKSGVVLPSGPARQESTRYW